MNVSHLRPDERIDKIVERVRWEARRKNKGALFHLVLRYWELQYQTDGYRAYFSEDVAVSQAKTLMYARGARDSLGYGIAVLMKYKHHCPGCTLDEVGAAIQELNKSKIFEPARSEHLPVPAGIG